MQQELVKKSLWWLASSIKGALIVIDSTEQIVFANKAAYTLFDLDPQVESIIGWPIERVFAFTGFSRAQSAVLRSLHEGAALTDVQIETDKGNYALDTTPISSDSEIIGAVVLGYDVSTEERIRKDLREVTSHFSELARLDRLNLVGEMAASIAHEIRNPMTTVRGFLQLLSTKTELQPYKRFTDLMIEEIDRANSIITTYLSLARTTVSMRPCDLSIIVRSFAPVLDAEALMREMHIVYNLDSVPEINANEAEIKQLLANLVKNALESMSPGQVVSIKTEADSDCVRLVVADQGSGISSDLLPKLGTPFITTKDSGTGLGLAVCYRIAERHRARINVETSSAGSIFTVEFPYNSGVTSCA